ncbi:CHAP domain-containing protein [Sphingomonas sp.]|uniref:CHAP domain-containing protein n=1 Tax=Sphingomonas sp. TaxID=28214 RepID=UPI001B2DDE8A|nr:CHAP domain-containing protein [Sphingomonas sp.]MBO9714512.1 CHAP domain-containing protein [Sphingomonas sp.]
MAATPAQAKFWQCAVFARQASGVEIYGNAWTWWSQAEGRYERGETPVVGSVMSFQRTGKMPLGHVAMVSAVLSEREVLLTHANWSRPGGIEHDVRAIDVSPDGDWSQVKVWFAPVGGLGSSVYPVNGFIYPQAPNALELLASGSARQVAVVAPKLGNLHRPVLEIDTASLLTADAGE